MPSPSLLTTILPLFNLMKCLSSFTSLSFTSSPLANDTEGHRRNTNRLNGVELVKRIHSLTSESPRCLNQSLEWRWRAKPPAKPSIEAMNSKELTEGNQETRDWKRSSNSNWKQWRSELRVVCLSLDLGFFFFFLCCELVVEEEEEEDVCAVWWWWRMFVLCGGGDILFYYSRNIIILL